MPPLPHAANIVRCAYSGTYGSGKWANIFFVRFTGGPPGQADFNNLATGLTTAWSNNIKALVNTGCSLTATNITELTSEFGLQAGNGTVVAGTGSATASAPANVALTVSFKIARRYRGGHPRMYLTGQIGGNITGSTTWAPAWITTVSTAMEAWRVAVNALTFTSMPSIQLVNLSYYSGHNLRATPLADVVNGVQVHTRVDTQRRRLGRELT